MHACTDGCTVHGEGAAASRVARTTSYLPKSLARRVGRGILIATSRDTGGTRTTEAARWPALSTCGLQELKKCPHNYI